MESVNIKAVANRKQELINEKKTILYWYESRRIFKTNYKSLKNWWNKNQDGKNVHAYVLKNTAKSLIFF